MLAHNLLRWAAVHDNLQAPTICQTMQHDPKKRRYRGKVSLLEDLSTDFLQNNSDKYEIADDRSSKQSWAYRRIGYIFDLFDNETIKKRKGPLIYRISGVACKEKTCCSKRKVCKCNLDNKKRRRKRPRRRSYQRIRRTQNCKRANPQFYSRWFPTYQSLAFV